VCVCVCVCCLLCVRVSDCVCVCVCVFLCKPCQSPKSRQLCAPLMDDNNDWPNCSHHDVVVVVVVVVVVIHNNIVVVVVVDRVVDAHDIFYEITSTKRFAHCTHTQSNLHMP
jgi:hypothetical protein